MAISFTQDLPVVPLAKKHCTSPDARSRGGSDFNDVIVTELNPKDYENGDPSGCNPAIIS